MRIDQILVQHFAVKSRSQALDLIHRGQVLFKGIRVKKGGLMVEEEDFNKIELLDQSGFVGRGAYKLEAALLNFKVQVQAKIAADIGASTGGFTQVLLRQGVQKVYAIDVGHNQLDESLKSDERVCNFEGINMRYPFVLPEKVDLVVVDVSFISLRKIWSTLLSLLKDEAEVVALYKPQFEESSLHEFLTFASEVQEWQSIQEMACPLLGKEGTQEFLLFFRRVKLKE